ncbi:site-specific integrase [Methylobacillus flagellatus]|uniref:tyrosine-type recombinase/integrase n=1 Tax=Methylobacillus flagellatus TaxID=405 RepID=UPI002854158C|nr:site-specific integrase [Methylobacillus flagellatus]MDR5172974.1 site-specific integrase [Methylobacillus flagellatus]
MPLKIYRRGDVWHYRGTVAGRRLRGSTGTGDKAIAQRIAAEREATAWKGNLDGPEAILTFAQAATLYSAAGKADYRTLKVMDYWKDMLVRDINEGLVRQAALTLYPTAKGATRNRQVIVPTQAIINHAAELGKCRKLTVKRFAVPRVEKTPITWAWVQAFMAAAPPHLGALACFMFLTGARVSEALAVRWEDVNFEERRVKIRQTKLYGEERMAHLPQPLIVAIANCKRDRDNVFRYVSRGAADKSWRSVVRRIGLPMLSAHACRHGFATAMLHAGVDPVTTAKRGGWKNVQHVFKTYGHAMEDETVTDRLIGTPVTQRPDKSKKRV